MLIVGIEFFSLLMLVLFFFRVVLFLEFCKFKVEIDIMVIGKGIIYKKKNKR